ncbi:acyl-CoA dehydrogenase family protein [Streptomyces sp. NPDC002851]
MADGPALTYGRLSVAWGSLGILRAALRTACAHARTREQFGRPLSEHQLIARHLAELHLAHETVARSCEHASRSFDEGSPDAAIAAVAAKQHAARSAARGPASALQVLGAAGARESGPVARAYRDAKLMEIIEGSNEIGHLLLSEHALARWS